MCVCVVVAHLLCCGLCESSHNTKTTSVRDSGSKLGITNIVHATYSMRTKGVPLE